ncbi:universal stress protein [Burkholderia cenocepacia]|uniref:universal stress protein n=1 Tax=Burkholderia cenocepacia TaxID=95486 RepID=UPI00209B60BE|nr:universal stress protein [Burkholderia cenocepacia]
MYRHLLVTVDDAPGGIDAIGDALELARAVGARVTFVLPAATPDSRLSGARLPGHGAKVEAAARAQGLSHGIAGAGQPGAGHPGAGDASPGVLAGELGCDLIGVAALPPDADAVARAQRRQLLATSGVPVLVCPSRRAPAAARVIARCLDAHRMAGGGCCTRWRRLATRRTSRIGKRPTHGARWLRSPRCRTPGSARPPKRGSSRHCAFVRSASRPNWTNSTVSASATRTPSARSRGSPKTGCRRPRSTPRWPAMRTARSSRWGESKA